VDFPFAKRPALAFATDMKWLIAIVGAALMGWFIWFQVNTTKISYVNGLAPYDVMPGREFILQQDCLVFSDREHPTSGFPLLGTNHRDARTRIAALPETVTADLRGKELPRARILDLIPRGTRFLITSVRREQSRRAGTVITYEAKFLDGTERTYQKVDLRPILLPVAQQGDVPEIDTSIAAPWVKR
jgi:hypothetical protein